MDANGTATPEGAGNFSDVFRPPTVTEAQASMMLAAAVSQLSAALWGLAEAIRGHTGNLEIGANLSLQREPVTVTRVRVPKGPEVARQGTVGAGISDAVVPLTSNTAAAAAKVPEVTVRYADVQAALQSVAHDRRFGHSGALEILQRYGVNHGQALEPSQYADVLDSCRTALAQPQ